MNSKDKHLKLIDAGVKYLGPGIEGFSDSQLLASITFDRYDKDHGNQLGHTEVANILIDMYRSMNKKFTPSKQDIDQFSKILDMNRDGKIDPRDMEQSITKALKIEVSYDQVPGTTGSRLGLSTAPSSGLRPPGSTYVPYQSSLTTSTIIR